METQRYEALVTVDEGHQPGVVRVALDRLAQRCVVRSGLHPSGQGAQQGLGEGQQAGDGGERIAGEAHQVAPRRQPAQQHGVARPYGDPVHQQLGARSGEHRVDMVDRPRRRSTGGQDQIRLGFGDRAMERLGVVTESAGGDDLGAESAQPGRDHRPQGVADQPVVGESPGQQLIAEDEDLDARTGDGQQLVVTGGRGQAQHGGRHRGAAWAAAGRRSGTPGRVT